TSSLSPRRMRSETRRQDRDRKSFYRRAWESRDAGEIQTGRCRGGQTPVRLGLGRGEKESKVGDFKMAIDWRSGLDPRCYCCRRFSFLAAREAEELCGQLGDSGKIDRRAAF